MFTPEVPTRFTVRKTVLDNEPHGQLNHPFGILGIGCDKAGVVLEKV
jgi:hypothetical protein